MSDDAPKASELVHRPLLRELVRQCEEFTPWNSYWSDCFSLLAVLLAEMYARRGGDKSLEQFLASITSQSSDLPKRIQYWLDREKTAPEGAAR